MTWMNEHRRVWRVVILALTLLAWIGPWVFDQINVPAQYTCSAPFIRLEGDYCGAPMSGMWMLAALVGNLANIIWGMVTGMTVFTGRARELASSLLGLLVVLPWITTLYLVLRGDNVRRAVAQIVLWLPALGLGLLWGISVNPKLFWALWGVWLYALVAAGALILEITTLAAGRRMPRQVEQPE